MGYLSRSATVVGPGRVFAGDGTALGDPWFDDRWFVPDEWIGQVSASGVGMSPELAMTLSAVYSGVTMIADDIGSMPCQLFKYLDNGDNGKERARNHPLAEVLRWQPNLWQTSKEFWSMMIGHYLLRGNAYAEIIPGPRGFADQLIPRHPDRISPERLSTGRVRFKFEQHSAEPRYLTQDQMFVLRDFSSDGLKGISRIAYAMRSLSLAITQERYTANFYETGVSGSVIATYKGGELDDEGAKALHASLGKLASGVSGAGGIIFIEDDVDVKSLGIDLDKAQLNELKTAGIHDVERWLKLPPGKLGAGDSTHADAAVELSDTAYGTTTLRPILIGIEQAIRRDLILQPQTYFAEFNMDARSRASLSARGEYYAKAVGNWLWPSEIRMLENRNPDPDLDALAKVRQRPGTPKGSQTDAEPADLAPKAPGNSRAQVRATLLAYDVSQQVLRRETDRVTKIAEQHAKDPDGWKAGLQAFYAQHADFVAQKLRIPMREARAYAERHRAQLAADGVGAMQGWEHTEAEALVALAQGEDTV